MADIFSEKKRSDIMSKVKGKDTKPEMLIRSALHRLGYRYSLHKKGLPGKPDLYFRKYNAVIEVNGCFWHGHDCHFFSLPQTRTDLWRKKINNNKKRDIENLEKLKEMGLRVLLVWECAIKGKNSYTFEDLIKEIESWLKSDIRFKEISGTDHSSSK
ncbi:very short patch repair endonuclease [Halalkalibaculum sp. DA3122]|uniref:very short patch repair endonuclease n=1 Tax=Halalkalibaculum sp. DA3122 TaxID=3373607 RepID=UPI003754B8F3